MGEHADVGTQFDITILDNGRPAITLHLEQRLENVVYGAIVEFGDIDYSGIESLLALALVTIRGVLDREEGTAYDKAHGTDSQARMKNDDPPF